jgi:hypothetical protein
MPPSQYAAIIKTVWKNEKPFKVHELDHDSHLYIKNLTEQTAVNSIYADVSEE